MEFDELQLVWQSQSAPVELEAATQGQIATFQKRIRRNKRVLYILLPLTSLILPFFILTEDHPLYIAGIAISIFAMALAIIQYRRIGPVDQPQAPGESTTEFLQQQLQQFERQDRYAKRFIPVYMLLLWLGQISCAFSLVWGKPTEVQAPFLVGYGIGMLVFFSFVYWISLRQMRKKWGGLRAQVQKSLETMQESEAL